MGIAGFFFLAAGANLETRASADHYSCFAAALIYSFHVTHVRHFDLLNRGSYAQLLMAKVAGCPIGGDALGLNVATVHLMWKLDYGAAVALP